MRWVSIGGSQQMARQMYDVTDIVPGKKDWTVMVQVIERHPVLLSKQQTTPFPRRYRNYLLSDMKGTKLALVMFDNNIQFFERSLFPFKRYTISNAHVTPLADRFRVSEYEYSWTITNRTPVEPVDDEVTPNLPCTFPVTKISELYKHADKDESICVKALVIHAFPPITLSPTQTIKEYVIINEENIPIIMRLWKDLLNEYDDNTDIQHKKPVMIIATNLKVTAYLGLSLSSRYTTYIIQNPPLGEDYNIQNWLSSHKPITPKWLSKNIYHNIGRFFLPPQEDEIVTVETAMKNLHQMKTAWVKGNLEFVENQEQLWVTSCGHCCKMLDSTVGWVMKCNSCNNVTTIEPRTKIAVTFYDYFAQIHTTIDSPDADNLIYMTPLELQEADNKGKSLHAKAAETIRHKAVICFIKYYEKEIRGEKVRRYPVLKVYTQKEVEDFNQNRLMQTEAQSTKCQTKIQHVQEKAHMHIGSNSPKDVNSAEIENTIVVEDATKVPKAEKLTGKRKAHVGSQLKQSATIQQLQQSPSSEGASSSVATTSNKTNAKATL